MGIDIFDGPSPDKNGQIRDEKGKFLRGNPGKPKGAINKFTSLKNAFLEAFEELGGVKGLVEWAKKNEGNKRLFYQLISKMLPSNVVEDIKHEFEPLTVIINEDGDEPPE